MIKVRYKIEPRLNCSFVRTANGAVLFAYFSAKTVFAS